VKRAVLVLPVLLLTGCSLYDTPLPGGAALGDHPYHVTVQFTDVLDLVPQSSVKVDDVAVGRVDRIDLAPDNKTALVDVLINGSVRLPANSGAQLGQSSLLGEKYVEITAPQQPAGQLTDGSVITRDRTGRSPEIEEVLGALSLLLNGGDIGQIQNIVKELNAAMTGNEPQIRSFLSQVDNLVRDLDGQKDNVVKAIDAMNRLTTTLAGQRDNLATALDRLGPGLKVVTEQRDELTSMLNALDNLSSVAVDTINRGRDDLVGDLRQLQPVLQKLAETGSKLPTALEYLATYPFSDYAAGDVKGDYFNSDIRFDLDLSALLGPQSPIIGGGR
jgi:phospholipid/cholesterol/gamma-HCH transport system substrate-binding protein